MISSKIDDCFAIIAGRWQPFHKGHLELLRYACNQYEQVIIGIVNADPKNPPADPSEWPWFHPAVNPFNYWERHWMIWEMVKEEGIESQISAILPMRHAVKFGWGTDNYLLPPSSHRIVLMPLVNDSEVQRIPALRSITKLHVITDLPPEILTISASKIRSTMFFDQEWQQYLPPTITRCIQELDGIQRIKNLYQHFGIENIPKNISS